MDEIAIDDLAACFLARTLSKEEWTHAAPRGVGAWHVHNFGSEEAVPRLRAGIRALNEQHGTANTETAGYHETITIAHLQLIDQWLSRSDVGASLPAGWPRC